jgi:hypothetical protein
MVFMPHSKAVFFIGFGFLGTIRKNRRIIGISIINETKARVTKRKSAI